MLSCLVENSPNMEQNHNSSRKSFKVSNIPSDLLNNREAMILIERTIERIETSMSEEHETNSAYSAFMDLLQTEMDSKLKSHLIN